MPTLRTLYADPRVDVVRRPHATWIVAGRIGDGPVFDPRDGADDDVGPDFCRRVGDATVLRVDHADDDIPVRVRIWRGGASSYEAYYAVRPNGDVIVADHFRNAATLVPVAERQPSEAVAMDHFLFRHARGRETYAASIRRVGHGDVATIDLRTGRVDVEVFHRMVSSHEPRPVSAYVADLDDALRREMESLRSVPGVVTMLSGGMDSTLMQSYVKDDVPALHVVPDASDFRLGGAHIDAAAAALGVVPERVVVRTDDFLAQLEDSIDARGVPPHFPQWVTLRQAYETAHEVFVIGERAGSYARVGSRIPYHARRFSRFPGSLVQPLLRAVAFADRPHRLRLLADQAPALSRDPESPDGWGAQMPQSYGDRRWVERVYGRTAVRDRFAERLDYVHERVELLPATAEPYDRHLELGHWSEFYNENNSQFRSLAFACGRSMVDPYTSSAVMEAMLAVPPQQRYEQGIRSKYIVEDLLHQRVPAYPPVKKDEIVVPFRKYWTAGSLTGFWDSYDVPPMFTGRDRDRLVHDPTESSWNAVTWAVWQARIASNARLSPLPATVDRTWDLAGERSHAD